MLMKQAESAYALKNYDEMKRILDSIDSNSRCADSASEHARKAGIEIRNEEKEALAREERALERANVPTLRKSTTASESTNSRSKKLPLFPA